jgi:hypothetical protein
MPHVSIPEAAKRMLLAAKSVKEVVGCSRKKSVDLTAARVLRRHQVLEQVSAKDEFREVKL